ncbi:MAG: hypothetical protein JXQ96_17820 [Cyclobacteriaceae bacterium]
MTRRKHLKILGTLTVGMLESPIDLLAIGGKKVKIAFIGDSITQNGTYIDFLSDFFKKHKPDLNYELINCGLSSETITGLTENEHPGPRPYLFDRLDSELGKHQPDIAYFCYGINCGIYNPFSKQTLDAYKNGLSRILKATGKRKIEARFLNTPPLTLSPKRKSELIANPPENYSWKNPFPHYDKAVLAKFRLEVEGLKDKGISVVDICTPLLKGKELAYGADPIHPNNYGHFVMAKAIWASMGYKAKALEFERG